MDRLDIGICERDGRVYPVLSRPRPVAVEALVLGHRAEEAVALLGRVFGLCRHAQESAARLAFGLPPADPAPLAEEILRDTLFRLFVDLPPRLGLRPLPLPPGWRHGGVGVARAAFGPDARPPADIAAFRRWLASDHGLTPVLRRLVETVPPREGASRTLPGFDGQVELCENSGASRYLHHPLMSALERQAGRGPLWRSVGRLLDLDACLRGALPAPRLVAPGTAISPATRGSYLIAARLGGGRIAALSRRTPTDDLCRPGGALETTLAALPWSQRALAPLVVSCLDPCLPWQVMEVADA